MLVLPMGAVELASALSEDIKLSMATTPASPWTPNPSADMAELPHGGQAQLSLTFCWHHTLPIGFFPYMHGLHRIPPLKKPVQPHRSAAETTTPTTRPTPFLLNHHSPNVRSDISYTAAFGVKSSNGRSASISLEFLLNESSFTSQLGMPDARAEPTIWLDRC